MIANSVTSVTKLAYFRPQFPVWLPFFKPKTLSKITISAPQNAHFQPFSRAPKPSKTYNTLIPSNLQTIQNSLIYDQTVTKSQEAPSRESICKDYSKPLVE
jgi:hypothetical protein